MQSFDFLMATMNDDTYYFLSIILVCLIEWAVLRCNILRLWLKDNNV